MTLNNEIKRFRITDYFDDCRDNPADNEIIITNEIDGVRLIFNGEKSGDVLVERDGESGKWRIFVHPTGDDPIAIITMDEQIAIIESGDARPGHDWKHEVELG